MEIKNIYKIGVGTDYSSFNELKQQHVVSQGWPATGDLSFAFGDEEGFQLFSENLHVFGRMLDYNNDSKWNYTLPRLIKDIKTGDIILAFEGNSLVGITQIPEKFIYFYNECVEDYRNSLFPVQWVKWSDFCKDTSLQGQGGQGVKGIEKSGMTEINHYCILHWNEYISSENISLQPSECNETLDEFIKQFEEKKQKSKNIFLDKINYFNHKEMITPYTELLGSNKNIILTGAPGTGKTYLAKQIAAQMILRKKYDEETATDDEKKKMKKQCVFVQFHPSYDYTDFVEGLRPINDGNGNIVFKRQNGVFKSFCEDAIVYSSAKNTQSDATKMLEWCKNNFPDHPLKSIGSSKEIPFELKDGQIYAIASSGKKYPVNDDRIIVYLQTREYNPQHETYVPTVGKYILDNYPDDIEKPPYIFIIDEINRGEISKIFGELFFSIDPGYRGTAGRVKTQYQNLVKKDDVFYNGFYVPENVYIIGTMNDIDRSVESMDFAFRRRFAFKEVTAKESQQMLDSDSAWGKDENGKSRKPSPEVISDIKKRMDALNDAICPDNNDSDKKGIDGLSSAYHIGASYFLKLANYKKDDGTFDYDKLWDYHLKGLLFEYLRGMPDAEEKLDALRKAFEKSDSNPS